MISFFFFVIMSVSLTYLLVTDILAFTDRGGNTLSEADFTLILCKHISDRS